MYLQMQPGSNKLNHKAFPLHIILLQIQSNIQQLLLYKAALIVESVTVIEFRETSAQPSMSLFFLSIIFTCSTFLYLWPFKATSVYTEYIWRWNMLSRMMPCCFYKKLCFLLKPQDHTILLWTIALVLDLLPWEDISVLTYLYVL